mmetsp:Transcript_12912/g.31469  ORF Transcript_12912/g.31469 Transcript_12912/m.31469 type:complete len:106 (+) Transcript_12912:130-447(+)
MLIDLDEVIDHSLIHIDTENVAPTTASCTLVPLIKLGMTHEENGCPSFWERSQRDVHILFRTLSGFHHHSLFPVVFVTEISVILCAALPLSEGRCCDSCSFHAMP